jgi:hypothetical protein
MHILYLCIDWNDILPVALVYCYGRICISTTPLPISNRRPPQCILIDSFRSLHMNGALAGTAACRFGRSPQFMSNVWVSVGPMPHQCVGEICHIYRTDNRPSTCWYHRWYSHWSMVRQQLWFQDVLQLPSSVDLPNACRMLKARLRWSKN